MKTFLKAGLAATILFNAPTSTAFSQDDQSDFAMMDSYELQKLIEKEGEPSLRDFVKMYMGHMTCKYDFIVDDEMNRIADTSLKNTIGVAHKFLTAKENGVFKGLPEKDKGYVVNMIVLTMIGSLSSEISKGHSAKIKADPKYCEKNNAEDKAIYSRLGENTKLEK